MEWLLNFLICNWLWLAIVFSIYWGTRSAWLFTTDALQETDAAKYSFRKKYRSVNKFFMGSYQFVLNAVGSFAGWFCFHALLIRVRDMLPHLRGFSWGDAVLFVLALLGLTGHLPQVVVGFVGSFGKLGEALARKLTD